MTAKKGFTLIELLVVIAIIGILSAVVLTSLNAARVKARDARVKAEMSSLRASMEVYYDSHNGYGTATNDCTAGGFADASSYIEDLTTISEAPRCYAVGTAYAISVDLPSADVDDWCVDSAGTSDYGVAQSTGVCG